MIKASGGNGTSAGPTVAAAGRSRKRRRRPTTWVVALAAALLLGAVGFFGWRVFRLASAPDPARIAPWVHELKTRSGNGAARTVPAAGFERATVEPRPVAPGPPLPQTPAELLEEADLAIERLVESFPDDPNALEVKARSQFGLHETSTAVECWERCLELDPGYERAYCGLAAAAAAQADHAKAVALYRKAMTVAPGSVTAVMGLADALLKLGEIREAVGVLEGYIEGHPAPVVLLVDLGFAYLQAREYEDAKGAFQAVLKHHPDLPSAQFGLATALARLGQDAESREAMEIYRQMQNEVDADRRNAFDDLTRTAAVVAAAYTEASKVYVAHDKPGEAERLLLRAAALDPKDTQCRIQLAFLYQATNRGQEALEVYRECTRIAPEVPGFWLDLGVVHGSLGRFDAAEEAFEEAIRLAPRSPHGHVALARLYLHTGRRPAKAMRLAQEAVLIAPTAANYFLLGQAHAGNGDRAGAISSIRRAIDIDPRNRQYQEVLKMLQGGK